ncbi:MAG TPA: hypothetical protein PKZ84_11640 [Anaerolineae bacterium]|nr:hypothetical protein [Anaerolineae bacterium]
MAKLDLFQRKSLDEIITVPDEIISVYVVENHIWAEGGADASRAARRPERRTIEEFLINPVRPFLNDIFRQMAAPYQPSRKDQPIGQGYWIQAEFGSGKSHLLSFIGALALGGEEEWAIVQEKERAAGMGRRESLYAFYENGLAKKTGEKGEEGKGGKGILVAVKTLVGEGGGTIGVAGARKNLVDYVLDAVGEQFYLETGQSLPLYPAEILAERFLQTGDFERYQRDLAKYLQDPAYFDEEEREELSEFLHDLQHNTDPGVQRDCGQRLWDFYQNYLHVRPQIPMETEAVLKHMVQRLLEAGYAGLLLILDEVSLFMKGRDDAQRVEDEKALVVLSNRLAKVENLPVWTVCAAQQKIETKMAGVKNIIARERLDLVPLLNKEDYYYDIALTRVREIGDPQAVEQYYEDYKRSFSWPQAVGKDRFTRFFPFYPPSIDVIRAISYNLTSVRSALYFMLQTLKTQRKRQSRELITLWALFDDVVEYEEDPSGTTKSIASIKTKWPEEWRAYDTAKQQLDRQVQGPLKIYRSRCEKLIKTLFLYHIANMAPNGLSSQDLMNSVMEWKDHAEGQRADSQDNYDHYEVLAERVALELVQVEKIGHMYRFKPEGGQIDPAQHFEKARAEAENDELLQRQAWEALLDLDGWEISTGLMRLDLASGVRSIFRDVAPATQTDLTLVWHGREITGRVYMRDLRDIGRRNRMFPAINSAETGLDFAVFISSTPADAELDGLVDGKSDPRVLFWSPDALTPTEHALLLDFAAYRTLVGEYRGQDTEDARIILEWVQNRLRGQMGTVYRIVVDSFARGRIAALEHAAMDFNLQGELSAVLLPLVTQLLDNVYLSKELEFDAPAPFNDLNALNVINGAVKLGELERGAKPTKEVSASRNYGIPLQIMQSPNNRRLDLRRCRYTQDILAWLEERLPDATTAMPTATVYKNFMGMNGPGGKHYGLSRRMVQLYLLCLVQAGKIRIGLSGRAAPVEVLDYTNIATVDFKVSVLEAMDRIQRLKPPEGWDLLAPYAAVLLDDPALRETRQESDIQTAVQQILAFRAETAPTFRVFLAGMRELAQDLGLEGEKGKRRKGEREETPSPFDLLPSSPFPLLSSSPFPLLSSSPFTLLLDRLAAWETFLTSPVDAHNALPHVLNALDQAFGYRVYRDNRARSAEVDDLATRRAEVRQVERFYTYRDRLRAVAHYVTWAAGVNSAALPPDTVLRDVVKQLEQTRTVLAEIATLATNETRLAAELLQPAEEAIASYTSRYLTAFDRVTARSEEVRQQLTALADTPDARALAVLAQVPQLGSDPRSALTAERRAMAEALFPTQLTRATVERALRSWPQPPQCPLTLVNAGEWLQRADDALANAQTALRVALLEKARLLHSTALRERLAQGQEEAFIAGMAVAPTAEALADYLAETLGAADHTAVDARVALLNRYLKRLSVRKVRLSEFAPRKRTLERADVDGVVADFRAFLLRALETGDEDELPIVELES